MQLGCLIPPSRSKFTLSRRKQCFGPLFTTSTTTRNRNITTMCNEPSENSTQSSIDVDVAAAKFGWGDVTKPAKDYSKDRIMELPLSSIKRPLQRLRQSSKLCNYLFNFSSLVLPTSPYFSIYLSSHIKIKKRSKYSCIASRK